MSDLNDGDKPNDEALDLSKVHQEDFFHETIHIPMNKWKHSGIETPEVVEWNEDQLDSMNEFRQLRRSLN